MTDKRLSIGDPVEIEFSEYVGEPIHDVVDEWIPGTVCSVDRKTFGIAFADGTRTLFQLDQPGWRRPKLRTQTMPEDDKRFTTQTVITESGEHMISLICAHSGLELLLTPTQALMLCGDLIEAYSTVLNLVKGTPQ